jgi:hypothetical protein
MLPGEKEKNNFNERERERERESRISTDFHAIYCRARQRWQQPGEEEEEPDRKAPNINGSS